MIYCYVCGNEVQGGWAIGFPPSPDSLKMGLCPDHDTPDNRKNVEEAWNNMMADATEAVATSMQQKAAPYSLEITILYISGKTAIMQCQSYALTEENTLKINIDGSTVTYIPMHLIKQYTVTIHPHTPSTPSQEKTL